MMYKSLPVYFSIIFALTLASCYTCSSTNNTVMHTNMSNNGLSTAYFGNGCFWCTEVIFEELKGVKSAVSGYSGGITKNPSYKEVSTGLTGHAECIEVVYDTAIISYKELLEVFWQTHDPTTLNRQGNDVGTQYRSVVFYQTQEEKNQASFYKEELNKNNVYPSPVVTEIVPFETFYPAENYHQEYYALNEQQNPYCRIVITPKLEKFRKIFSEKLKEKP